MAAKKEEVDTTKIPLDKLLDYNLHDSLATWYVYEKYYDKMVADKQKNIYETVLKPSMKVITHMELVGMPMCMDTIKIKHAKLQKILTKYTKILQNLDIVKDYTWQQQRIAMIEANLLLKKKIKSIDEFKEEFNPGSNKQVSKLLYDELGFDVVDKTKSGFPAVGNKTLTKLLNKLKLEYNITDKEIDNG